MKLIALFGPAILSLAIKKRRMIEKKWDWFTYVKEYTVSLLSNVFLSQAVITYVLGLDGVDSTAFESFPFFTKYIVIAVACAWILPYIREVVGRYISVSFKVGENDEK